MGRRDNNLPRYSSNSRGVAILIKNGVDCTIHRKILDPLGRYIILKAQIQEKTYVLINVYMYAPNKDKDLVKFFDNLLSILMNENLDSEDNIILGGDLNCPLNPLLDKKGGIFTKRKLQCSSKISELRIRVPYARTARMRMLTYAYAYVDIRV